MSDTINPNTEQKQSVVASVIIEEEKKLLLEWDAPSRPFKKRDKDFFTTVTMLAILSVVILFFMKEYLVIGVVFAAVFMVFVLYSVPPESIHNAIYTTGIQSGEHFYSWPELYYYWFEVKWNNTMLVARTKANLPGAVYLMLGEIKREQVDTVIGSRLLFKDTADSNFFDRAAAWLSKMFPLEKSS